MGSGRSPAGGGGGGGGGAVLPAATNQVVPPTPQQIAQGDVLPQGGVAFSEFEQMTDDKKAAVVDDALRTGVPMFLDDSGIQRFAYFTGLSDKPAIVTDSQLNSIQGTEIFRTVGDAYNSKTDIGYTGNDIAKQIMYGDFTMYSDSGGSAHGKAIYFADNYSDSAGYGYGKKNPVTVRGKITGKTITESQLTNDYRKALARGDKLAKACSNAGDSQEARNLYGLCKGYDVMSSSYGYQMVLNRRGITMSDTIKKTNVNGSKW